MFRTILDTSLNQGNSDIIANNMMFPDYSAGVALTLSTTNQTFDAAGYVSCHNKLGASFNNSTRSLFIDDIQFPVVGSSANNCYSSVFLPVKKGDTYKLDLASAVDLIFYPLKGNT